MKKLILSLIIGLVITIANAQTTLHELNLKGKVKSVREICYKAVQKGNMIKKGKKERESKQVRDGKNKRTT